MGVCGSCSYSCVRRVCRCQSEVGSVLDLLDKCPLMISSSSAHQTRRWKRPFAIHNSSLPPAAISFVVAQPQQTRSPVFAADKLPELLRRAMPPDPTAIQNNEQSPTTDFPESSPVIAVHESNLGAPSIAPLFVYLTNYKCIKILYQILRQPLPRTKLLSFLTPIRSHPLCALQPLQPPVRKTAL